MDSISNDVKKDGICNCQFKHAHSYYGLPGSYEIKMKQKDKKEKR